MAHHQLAQSQMFRELIALNHRAEETETTAGRLVQRSIEADARLSHETGAADALR